MVYLIFVALHFARYSKLLVVGVDLYCSLIRLFLIIDQIIERISTLIVGFAPITTQVQLHWVLPHCLEFDLNGFLFLWFKRVL